MAVFVILSFCVINAALCFESGSSELNRLEFTPLYETIIYSDIADIIKDYENAANPPIEAVTNNDEHSESDENIEDLLSEYQHYLEKAHKQRRNYLDKPKTKNKVPLLQRDRYSKSLAAKTNKHEDFYYNPNTFPFPKPQFTAPLDFMIPINIMRSSPYYGGPIKQQMDTEKQFPSDQISQDAKMLNLSPVMSPLISDKIPSSCYCEADTFPCECGCKQCLIALEPSPRRQRIEDENTKASSNKEMRSISDNTINIKIKVDVQFPQVQPSLADILKNKSNEKVIQRGSVSKESSINLPFFSFPYPLEMYNLQKTNKNTSPIHKITIHRKKKSKAGSNGKRHRKKVITYHDLKLEQEHSTQPSLDESFKMSDYRHKVENTSQINQANEWNNNTHIVELVSTMYTNNVIDKTTKLPDVNDTTTDDHIYFMVNISSSALDNTTEDVRRNENSIESEDVRVIINKGNVNASTEEPSLREKREVTSQNSPDIHLEPENVSLIQNITINSNDTMKKTDKSLHDDDELLYWPNNSKDSLLALANSKNITSLILDKENNKEKLNFSAESIRHDRSKALEEAIFGKVDWNDVDTVAPAFMSFMGKYIRGALSFCSDSICHSMKCAEMICVHRTCAPTDRTNNRGHCAGSNTTDSVASMESIMDLPSNIAFETVDILQQKMLGKLFGKATISIGSKCVTFTVSKKSFTKIKCTPKELDPTGHCTISKNTKII